MNETRNQLIARLAGSANPRAQRTSVLMAADPTITQPAAYRLAAEERPVDLSGWLPQAQLEIPEEA